MKWKKRIMMLMGMTVICTSVLTGCRRATPQSVIRLAQEKSRKAQSVEGNVQVDIEISAEAGSSSMTMGLNMDMDMEMTNDPAVYHMSGTMSVLPPGQTQSFELYGESEKDESTAYMKSESGWKKTTSKRDSKAEVGDLINFQTLLAKKDKLSMVKKTEDNKELYVITTELDGDEVEELIKQSMDSFDEESMIPDINGSQAKVIFKVYKDTGLPLALQIKLKGEAQLPEEDGVELKVEKLDVNIRFDKYDSVDKIKIPKEAKKAEEADEGDDYDPRDEKLEEGLLKDEEGNCYSMDTDGKYYAVIPGPKGFHIFTETAKSKGHISFEKGYNPGSITASYHMLDAENYPEEVMQKDAQELLNNYHPAERGYTDQKVEDEKTVTVTGNEVKYMSCSARDDDYTIYNYIAWIKVDSAYLQCDIDIMSYDENPIQVDESLIEACFADVEVEGHAKTK